MATKVRDILKALKADGWEHVRTRGDHRQFHHPTKKGTVTVAGHERDVIPHKTLKSIMAQSGLKGGE